MTHDQKTKVEEYLFDYITSSGSYNPPFQTEDLVEFAGYCIEQREKETGWKAYPQNKPTEIGMYLIIQDGLDAVIFDRWASDSFVHYSDVIAFIEIPKYKQ
jgi:hypothetical protein